MWAGVFFCSTWTWNPE